MCKKTILNSVYGTLGYVDTDSVGTLANKDLSRIVRAIIKLMGTNGSIRCAAPDSQEDKEKIVKKFNNKDYNVELVGNFMIVSKSSRILKREVKARRLQKEFIAARIKAEGKFYLKLEMYANAETYEDAVRMTNETMEEYKVFLAEQLEEQYNIEDNDDSEEVEEIMMFKYDEQEQQDIEEENDAAELYLEDRYID